MGVKVRERPAGSGIWWLFIDHQGKRKAKKVGRDKKLATDAAKKIEAKLTLGDFDIDEEPEAQLPTFQEYAENWLEGYIKPLRRASTYERYGHVLGKYVYPLIGRQSIDKIKRGDVRNALLAVYGRGLSRSTVCLTRDVISGVMGYAVDEELIPANPVSGITKRLQLERDKKITIEPLNHEETRIFLDTCREHFPEHYPLFLTAFRTGVRMGELLAIQWGDIDWHGKFIMVQRSYKNQKTSQTKTGRVRRVDMSDQLIGTLKSLYAQRKREALQTGSREIVETVFHRDRIPIAQNSIRYIFKRILRKAGLRSIRFHDIRHTYASLLLSNGQSPAYVKEQMGHHSIQMTVDIYGHLIPSSNREAVNMLDTQQSATYTQPTKIQEA